MAERFESLAEALGLLDPVSKDGEPWPDLPQQPREPSPLDIADPKKFAEAVLQSREFREYITNGLRLGTLPSAILVRVMDLAGWQKPPERIEHTGKDGKPIESVTEVRRIVVRSSTAPVAEEPRESRNKYKTH